MQSLLNYIYIHAMIIRSWNILRREQINQHSADEIIQRNPPKRRFYISI